MTTYTSADMLDRAAKEGVGYEPLTLKTVFETSPYYDLVLYATEPAMVHSAHLQTGLTDPGYRQWGEKATKTKRPADKLQQVDLQAMSDGFNIDRKWNRQAVRGAQNLPLDNIQMVMEAMALNGKRDDIGRNFKPGNPRGMYQWADHYNRSNNQVIVDLDPLLTPKSFSDLGPQATCQFFDRIINRCNGRPTCILADITVIEDARAVFTFTNNSYGAQQLTLRDYVSPSTGKVYQMGMWGVTPIIPMDYDSQRNPIFAYDENAGDGTGANCTSVVAVVWGPRDLVLMQDRDLGPEVFQYTQDGHPNYEIDWAKALWPGNDRDIVRGRGIKKSFT